MLRGLKSSIMRRDVALIFLGWLACACLAAAGPSTVQHEPRQPKAGQPVRITVEFSADSVPEGAVLEYQDVAPGSYVAKADPKYGKPWTPVPLTKSEGTRFAAELPAGLQQNRHLVRYRVRSLKDNRVLLPPADDAQGNYAYFVYDGVPSWTAAVNPRGNAAARAAMTFSPEVLTRVPVYHLIADRGAVENVMWKEPTHFGDEEARHAYRYTGTFVYDGVVHDHVKFRARGGAWRHAMGKNMWKLNFNNGHRLAARDHYGKPYAGKWDKLNLGACIQQGDYGMRGEQGMVEALTYRLFNLAGVEAPRTHWVHFRVVTDAEETPRDQYRGDFWGLYLATEEADGDFLKEHGMPEGNIYKMNFGEPSPEHLAKGVPDTQNDIRAFLRRLGRGGRGPVGPDWWLQNVNLPHYYSYRAALEFAHHYDIEMGKNYFFHLNLTSKKWQVIPWDVDLSWGEQMFGHGNEPFYRAGVLRQSPFREDYQERLAELSDLLFDPEQIGRLIDEHAAMIWDPKGGPSLADADRAKWDYHPIMSSRHVDSNKTRPGLFYFGEADNRFNSMITALKAYALRRQKHLERLLDGYNPPPSAKVSAVNPGRTAGDALTFRAESATAVNGAKFRWRLAEVTYPKSPVFNARSPWRYEIQPLWESELTAAAQADVPAKLLVHGHTYRVRVRLQHADGRWSRWSEPVQFVAVTEK